MRYSGYGWHKIGPLSVYHQGGFDTYCGLYSILNLVNFLKLKKCASNEDFIGADDFREFKRFIETGALDKFFPQWPFGGDGLEPSALVGVLSHALAYFTVGGRIIVEDDHSIAADDTSKWDRWFRYGAEIPFVSKEMAEAALGLACVLEDKYDKLGHWVVLVGKNHLKGTSIKCEPDWDGVVLDSDRGYERWRAFVDSELPRIKLKRSSETAELLRRDLSEAAEPEVWWIYSFVSVGLIE